MRKAFMLLFLASTACNVLDQIGPYLDRSPAELKVGFIPTAANPSPSKEGVENDRNKLVELGFTVVDIDVSTTIGQDLGNALEQVNVIFVAGGNTFYLLQESEKSGFSQLLVEFVRRGIPYIGSSAGSVLVGTTVKPIELMDDPQLAPQLTSYQGLGLVNFVPLVHYGDDEFMEGYKNALAELYSIGPRFILIRDHEFLVVKDDYWKLCG